MHEILHFVQNDKRGIFIVTTQSLKGEDVKLHSLSKIYSCGPALEVMGGGGYDPSEGDL